MELSSLKQDIKLGVTCVDIYGVIRVRIQTDGQTNRRLQTPYTQYTHI